MTRITLSGRDNWRGKAPQHHAARLHTHGPLVPKPRLAWWCYPALVLIGVMVGLAVLG